MHVQTPPREIDLLDNITSYSSDKLKSIFKLEFNEPSSLQDQANWQLDLQFTANRKQMYSPFLKNYVKKITIKPILFNVFGKMQLSSAGRDKTPEHFIQQSRDCLEVQIEIPGLDPNAYESQINKRFFRDPQNSGHLYLHLDAQRKPMVSSSHKQQPQIQEDSNIIFGAYVLDIKICDDVSQLRREVANNQQGNEDQGQGEQLSYRCSYDAGILTFLFPKIRFMD